MILTIFFNKLSYIKKEELMMVTENEAPADYRCHACGAKNCRLFREKDEEVVQPLCWKCSGRKVEDPVPAIPTQSGLAVWPVSDHNTPDWWKKLPFSSERPEDG
jgi:DNA-directed RNA polymerase subunit RPC12/RpoP